MASYNALANNFVFKMYEKYPEMDFIREYDKHFYGAEFIHFRVLEFETKKGSKDMYEHLKLMLSKYHCRHWSLKASADFKYIHLTKMWIMRREK